MIIVAIIFSIVIVICLVFWNDIIKIGYRYKAKYLLKDKTLISFRAKKTTRVMTDEQRKASAERLRKARENKSV